MPRESIRTKCVWSPILPEDGLRILVTRFRGRGMCKSRYDLWLSKPSSLEITNEVEWPRS